MKPPDDFKCTAYLNVIIGEWGQKRIELFRSRLHDGYTMTFVGPEDAVGEQPFIWRLKDGIGALSVGLSAEAICIMAHMIMLEDKHPVEVPEPETPENP